MQGIKDLKRVRKLNFEMELHSMNVHFILKIHCNILVRTSSSAVNSEKYDSLNTGKNIQAVLPCTASFCPALGLCQVAKETACHDANTW